MKELIEKLRDTASKGVSVWGDLQIEAADAIERLELEAVAATIRMDNDAMELAGLRLKLNNSARKFDVFIGADAMEVLYQSGLEQEREITRLEKERDEWKARCEFSFGQRDNLEKVIVTFMIADRLLTQ